MYRFIQNIGEYFPSNYVDEDFGSKVFSRCGHPREQMKEFSKRITPLRDKLLRLKEQFISGRLRRKDRIRETHLFHTELLKALGYPEDTSPYATLFHLSEDEVIPVRQILHRGNDTHLMVMEMQALFREDDEEPDGLFEQRYNTDEDALPATAQRYHRSQWEDVFIVPNGLRISPVIINKAVSQLFLLDQRERPKYILLLAGNVVYLLEQEHWFRGSYLAFDLEELFSEATVHRTQDLPALFFFLTAKETLSPESDLILLEQLGEDGHKSAYEVTKDLKEGVIHAVEALANEALFDMKGRMGMDFDETDDRFEQEMRDDCLTLVYRLLFVFYAESRPDLGILPIDEPVYARGYSLDMLRELEQVPLFSQEHLDGFFFHDTLSRLFLLLTKGYRQRITEENTGQELSFAIRPIDSPLFNDRRLRHLGKVRFRNRVWQDIICRLSLNRAQKGRGRGRISYANLGINQLGSVYESLLAFRGFYAEQDYIEVHEAKKPSNETYLVARSRRDQFKEEEILKTNDGQDAITPRGAFVYRLSGRDRQRSASFYTPEVLTRCTVKYTLKPLLDKLDRAEMQATDLLSLKLLEPAMGAAAFQNEMIDQLAEAYITRRQQELRKAGRVNWRVEPDKYREELQKVKAYIATHNVYGVDINPTAIELGKLSLWLNVIHRDMEPPFFGNRLAAGNAVVGSWLRVWRTKELVDDAFAGNGRPSTTGAKKEWWATAPRQLAFTPGNKYDKIRHGRKSDEIYHFLLGDPGMVSSASNDMLKDENPREVKAIREWRKSFCAPLRPSETERLMQICENIDKLLTDHYRFTRTLDARTEGRHMVWGLTAPAEQTQLDLLSYAEKEALSDTRFGHNAPYFKLKMVMDYWCALWFWDMRDAQHLPDREQYWRDVENILDIDTPTSKRTPPQDPRSTIAVDVAVRQQELFAGSETAKMPEEETDQSAIFAEAVAEYADRKDLFDDNRRIRIIRQLGGMHRFFHPQLEFLEVFWERGGFDLIAGNPPWLKLQFEEKGIISEKFPEVEIRKMAAPDIRKKLEAMFHDQTLKDAYLAEWIGTDASGVFMNAMQNYPLLIGQQTNLYKCILENGFQYLGTKGYMGLLHPEGVYDDPAGGPLRKEIYQRLEYHFQFTNELALFSEVHNQTIFGLQVYRGNAGSISFHSISNLFHPTTIDGCFIHDGHGACGGIKIKEEQKGFAWNVKPHWDRIVRYDSSRLSLLSRLFENDENGSSAKLVSIHTVSIINILEKLSLFKGSVADAESDISVCWDETNDVKSGNIQRNTRFPDLNNYEMVYSGPHFFVSNPLYKSPKLKCVLNTDYDIIDLTEASPDFIARTNYIPAAGVVQQLPGFNGDCSEGNRWADHYKVGFRRRLSQAGERTMICSLLPPKTSHVHTVISVIFVSEIDSIELTSLCSSIVLDFYCKTVGAADLVSSRIQSLPIGIEKKYLHRLVLRTLCLNCLNENYSDLWQKMWKSNYVQENWSLKDPRLKSFNTLRSEWTQETPLRNWFERRQALVEVDVITSMALGLSLDDLILIYEVQFSVLRQYEDDTWYDAKGNIVFTCSKGLSGVGVDRPIWKTIQHLPAGETYEHTITKSELYQGHKVVFHAPFEKCDRVEDYRRAWKHFEAVLGG